MSKIIRLIVLLYAVLCSQTIYAQNAIKRTLNIDEMFRLADENSQRIKTYATGTEVALEAVKAAKSQRLPEIDLSASVSYLGNGRIWDRDFKNGQNAPIPHFGNNFSLQASQVVYAGGAINSAIALAELGNQMANLDMQKNKQEIRFLLIGYYLNVYQLNNQEQVFKNNIDLTKMVIANMMSRHKEGTALKSDITRYELQLEKIKLQLAKVQDARQIMNHQMVTTLHLPENSEIIPDSTLLSEAVIPQSENDWQTLATESNVGLEQAKLSVNMSNSKLKLERSAQLPKVVLVAENHMNGPITIEVPPINKNFNYWFVGVGVKYNISSLFKNSRKISGAKLSVRRAEEEHSLASEEIENAVHASYIEMMTSYTELQTSLKSRELANENYKVVSNRYENELALLTELLDAANMKLDAELGLVNAKINVVYNHYKIKYITHTL
ncbi:TolC family protein [Phocaeicola paurosaccharolyticus]|jgi:outer membrane protein|uniref:TolC family protein n=1 Tax=Phocaeicola paurosaccharolyticus TaxID=732242 RepID=UPI002FE30F74